MFRNLILIILGCLLTLPILAQSSLALKGEALQNAGYAVYVTDAVSGKVLFATRQISLVPASVMKVVTTAAALEILGTDFVFHTQIGTTGNVNVETGLLEGNLVLKSGCFYYLTPLLREYTYHADKVLISTIGIL